MRKHTSNIFVGFVISILVLIGPAASGAFAQDKAAAPKPHELSPTQVKELIAMMDADKNGKISKQEWMNFMAAEFDRLDKDKSGELDPKELTQSSLQPSSFPRSAGK